MKDLFDPYFRAMFGQNAFQVPFNIISQRVDDTHAAGIWQFQASKEMINTFHRGSKAPHVLLVGSMTYQPALICDSEKFCGMGVAGLYRSGFIEMENWTPRFCADEKFKDIIKPRHIEEA